MKPDVPVLGEQVGIVKPLVNADEAVRAFNEYQQLKNKLRSDGDFVKFKVKRKDPETGKITEEWKECPTKQWRSKLTRFFGISVEVVSEEIQTLPDGSFVVKAVARAIAPNGLYMYGDGSCWSRAKEDGKGDLYHNTRSHAVTRAKNRAVLELVGFGEVSAEEIEHGEEAEGKSRTAEPRSKSGNGAADGERARKIVFAAVNGWASKAGIDPQEANEVAREILRTGYKVQSCSELTDAQWAQIAKAKDRLIAAMERHFYEESRKVVAQESNLEEQEAAIEA